ncbi:MAG: FctA domain-containing protein, partial [Eubacteriales bacterium]
MKHIKSIARFTLVCLVLSTLLTGLPMPVRAATDTGDFTFTTPTTGTASSYDVIVAAYHYKGTTITDPGADFTYTIGNADGSNGTLSGQFTRQWDVELENGYVVNSTYNGQIYRISGIPLSTKVTISGIATSFATDDSGLKWKEYDSVKMNVWVADSADVVTFTKHEAIEIVANDVVDFGVGTVSNLKPNATTTDTFGNVSYNSKYNGSYSVDHFLAHYNAVSLEEIEGTHIVGPIIALDHAARTGFSYQSTSNGLADGNSLVASDLSHGYFSYVGKLYPDPKSPGTSAVKLGYDFDLKVYPSGFSYPSLYSDATHQKVFNKDLYGDNIEHVVEFYTQSNLNGSIFSSPNAGGVGAGGVVTTILQNNSFMSQSSLSTMMTDASAHLLSDGVIPGEASRSGKITTVTANTVVSIPSYGDAVQIKLGQSYTITQGTGGEKVGIINIDTSDYPSYSYATDTDPITTINIDKSALVMETSRAGQSGNHYIFPKILVDGTEIKAGQGDGSGYDDGGEYNLNKFTRVIWNIHDVGITEYLSFSGSVNIPGHIIAPTANIRHYEGTASSAHWNGGNLNGCMIANSIQSGLMEFHLWPYGEISTLAVQTLGGTKTLTDGTSSGINLDNFSYNITSSNPSTNENVIGNADGSIDFTNTFDTIVSSLADGSYTFEISEEQSLAGGATLPDGRKITYDQSVYEVVVVVSSGVVSSYTVNQTKDSDGIAITPSSATIDFNNTIIAASTTKLTLNGTKSYETASGTPIALVGDDFEFNLILSGGVTDIPNVKNDINGDFSYELTFDTVGTYTYTLTEVDPGGGMGFIDYDDTKYTIEIEVTNPSGVLAATVTSIL